MLTPDDELTSECEEVCLMLEHCMRLREKYVFVSALERDPGAAKPRRIRRITPRPREALRERDGADVERGSEPPRRAEGRAASNARRRATVSPTRPMGGTRAGRR